MNTDEMLFWMEDGWANEPMREREKAEEPRGDMEDYAPWNKGRIS